jgi:hypothetical protein
VIGILLSLVVTSEIAAGDHLARAKAAIEAAQYDVAADELEIVVQSPDATEDQRFEANILGGVANKILGRDVEARQHFRYVLLSQPYYELHPSTPSDVVAFFNDVRREVRAELAQRPAHPMEAAPVSAEPGIAPVVLLIGGATLLVVGGATAAITEVQLGTARPLEERDNLLSIGRVGLAGAAIGAAATAGAGAWLVWSDE